MTIISLTSIRFQDVVEQAAKTIKSGGIIVAPTDTVYGLLADATKEQSVNRIFLIKKRPAGKFLPLFVKNMAMAKKFARISAKQELLLEDKWPGRYTAVLQKKDNIKIFGIDQKTLALRIPANQFINSLLEITGTPLTGTSANISGMPATTKIDEVLEQFSSQKTAGGGLPDLIVNAGDLAPSTPSMIVDLTKNPPEIIRR